MSSEIPTDAPVQPLRIPVQSRGRSRQWGRPARIRWGRRARLVSSIVLGGVVLAILLVTATMALGLERFTVIDSGSMRPTLNPGDVAVLTSERSADLAAGQIVAFHPPGEPRLTVVHRVRSIRLTAGGVIIRTKGDANNASDPWRAKIADGSTVWRESLRLPRIGYLVVRIQQPYVRMGVLTAMLMLVVSLLLGWIWRPATREQARHAAFL